MIAHHQHTLHAQTSNHLTKRQVQHSTTKAGIWDQGLSLMVAVAEHIVADKIGIRMGKQVVPWNQRGVEVVARNQESAELWWGDTGWIVGQVCEVAVSAWLGCALEVANLRRISEPRLAGRSGGAVCPDDTGNTVLGPGREAQAHAEADPCGVIAVMAKMQPRVSEIGRVRWVLFARAKMSDTLVGCPRLVPRK